MIKESERVDEVCRDLERETVNAIVSLKAIVAAFQAIEHKAALSVADDKVGEEERAVMTEAVRISGNIAGGFQAMANQLTLCVTIMEAWEQ